MGDKTKIEWTEATWNCVVGCSLESPGCTNCYAMKQAARIEAMHHAGSPGGAQYVGLTKPTKAGPVWTGDVRLVEHMLDQPLRWKRGRRIFVNSMSDLFHPALPDESIDRVFAVMALAQQHTYQPLTKRPDRMRDYLLAADIRSRLAHAVMDEAPLQYDIKHLEVTLSPGRKPNAMDMGCWPLPQIWLGVSVEDQKRADERRESMRALAAAGWLVWVSYEPALTAVDWTGWEFISWMVSGGENGPGARPTHSDWHIATRDWCAANGIAFLFKQWGSWGVVYDRDKDDPDWRRCDTVKHHTPNGQWLNLAGGQGFHGDRVLRVDRMAKKNAGRLLDGRTWDEYPPSKGTLSNAEEPQP